MNREDLKEIIRRVLEKMQGQADESPTLACIFNDMPCDVTTEYAVGEED